MKYGLRFQGAASVKRSVPDVGAWVMSYDPDGSVEWTNDPDHALRFDNRTDAFELWRKPSKVNPIRADGKPNRPLTAFTFSIEPLPEKAA
jgi:hypothetical protein